MDSTIPTSSSATTRIARQTQDWQTLPMTKTDDVWSATIPGEASTARFDHLYYLEARTENGGALWPNWLDETPYVVVSTSAP